MPNVSEQNIAAFERDGVFLVRQAFTGNWLDKLAIAVDEIMSDPSPLSREYVQDGDGRFFTDHHMSRRQASTFDHSNLHSLQTRDHICSENIASLHWHCSTCSDDLRMRCL